MAWFAPISQRTPLTSSNSGDGIIVGPDVTLSAGPGANAIYFSSTSHRAEIYGTVMAESFGAVRFGSVNTTAGHTVNIYAGAYIGSPFGNALTVQGFSSDVSNAGKLWSLGITLSMSANYVPGSTVSTLVNSGEIISAGGNGNSYGVLVGGGDDFQVTNSGLISATDVAVYLSTGNDILTNTGRLVGHVNLGSGNDVYNGATGNLRHWFTSAQARLDCGAGTDQATMGVENDFVLGGGDADTLRGNGGNDKLNGDAGLDRLYGGIGVDALDGGADNDLLYGDAGNDSLLGQAGLDRLYGGLGVDKLDGGADNDLLYGDAGNDSLLGQAGIDTLYGGLGIDTLSGGLSNDFFVFSAPVSAANRDIITDYGNVSGNNDTIRLENAYFTKIGNPGLLRSTAFKLSTQVKDADDRLIYNKVAGTLVYDADGSGAAAPVLIAQFTTVKPTLTYADFVVI